MNFVPINGSNLFIRNSIFPKKDKDGALTGEEEFEIKK